MPYFALFYTVVDNFVERRAPFRNEHLSWARQAHEQGLLLLAGALADPADSALLIFRADSANSARSFAEKDPYVLSGLVKHWEVRPWSVVIGGESSFPKASAAQGES